MPRKVFDIRTFDRGISSGIDIRDILPDAAYSSSDLDPGAVLGELLGRKGDVMMQKPGPVDFNVGAVLRSAVFLSRPDGGVDLVCCTTLDDTNPDRVIVFKDFPNGAGFSEWDIDAWNDDFNGYILLAVNHGVYLVGQLMLWLGYCYPQWQDALGSPALAKASWDMSFPSGNVVANNLWTPAGVGGSFGAVDCNYKWAFEYDGYMIGGLSDAVAGAAFAAGSTNKLTFEFDLDPTLVPRRATAVVVFRAMRAHGTDDPYGEYQRIARIPLDASHWDDVTVLGVDYKSLHDALVDTGDFGEPTYNSLTGLNDTVRHVSFGAELMATDGVSMFYGRIYSNTGDGIQDGDYLIFRSQPYRLDAVNWSENYVRLPVRPTALAFAFGRLFAFTNSGGYRINPQTLAIEDVWEGADCLGPEAVWAVPNALYWMGKDQISAFDGRQVIPISEPALGETYRAWVLAAQADGALFQARQVTATGSLVFARLAATSTAYVFTPAKSGRWDYWVFTGAAGARLVQGLDNELYIITDYVRKVARDSTRKSWAHTSGWIDLSTPSQKKRWYGLQAASSGTAPTLTVGIDGATIGAPPASKSFFKRFAFNLTGTATTVVHNVSLIYRELEGQR